MGPDKFLRTGSQKKTTKGILSNSILENSTTSCYETHRSALNPSNPALPPEACICVQIQLCRSRK